MSRKTSFEEALRQKLSELPLPDENESWQKMDALLDKKEKRRFFFFFRNGKMLGGALLFGTLLFSVILFTQTKKQTPNQVAYKKETTGKANQETYSNQATLQNNRQGETKETIQTGADALSSSAISPSDTSLSSSNKNRITSSQKTMASIRNGSAGEEKDFIFQPNNKAKNKKPDYHTNIELQEQEDATTTLNAGKQKEQTFVTADSSQFPLGKDSAIASSNAADSNLNTATLKNRIQKADSSSSINTVSATPVRAKPHGSFFIDIGIGTKQQIPIDSQAFVGYNEKGKKSWLDDYVPSLYIRLEKENRWFLQGEFHYASPRIINSISYWQKTKADYGHGSVTAERYYLQKTWYSQLPLSFNMYIRPSFSIGAGAMYNILHGAAAEKETSVYNAISNQYVSSYERLPWKEFTDSFLYKNNASLLVQVDYRLKRWSFGVRYLYDVQPFLTYTLPDGEKKDKRNTSLELMIRYRLYRSGKFRIGKL